jgi:hypothetical protein
MKPKKEKPWYEPLLPAQNQYRIVVTVFILTFMSFTLFISSKILTERQLTSNQAAEKLKNIAPIGVNESTGCQVLTGWTCDQSDFNIPLKVIFYKDGPAGVGEYIGETSANTVREDSIGMNCGGNTKHGFVFKVPTSLKDGRPHTIYAEANGINQAGKYDGNHPILSESPKSIRCISTP